MGLVQGCLKANMAGWKAKKLRKLANKTKGQTPGKKKNPETCQADSLKKYLAKYSKSYKHPEYGRWCKACDVINGRIE